MHIYTDVIRVEKERERSREEVEESVDERVEGQHQISWNLDNMSS